MPLDGVTLNEGDFSSWNGQSPLRLPPPALFRVTYAEITSSMRAFSRTSAMSSSLIRPATARSYVPPPTTRAEGQSPGSAALVDEPRLVGDDHGLDPVAHAELGEDPGDVRLHRRLRDDELLGDLGVRQAAGKETEHV